MDFRIAVVPGDGIGPEVVDAALEIAGEIGKKFGHRFHLDTLLAGGAAIDRFGVPLPEETVAAAKSADAVLLGAVGGFRWDNLPVEKRPERALLGLRKELGLYANLRPAKLLSVLGDACPLRREIRERGFDLVIVRELCGGLYYGERGRVEKDGRRGAFDTETYFEYEIDRILRVAFETALNRRKKLTLVDKANVLESSKLWRERFAEIGREYPSVSCDALFVDNASMQLIKQPDFFDVIVTSNMFGDILSDEASELTGSIGMIPSASLGDGKRGMYEAIHGSAPDIAGKNVANPIATILSFAMLMRYSLSLQKEADAVENAVLLALERGFRTADLAAVGERAVSTAEMTRAIADALDGE